MSNIYMPSVIGKEPINLNDVPMTKETRRVILSLFNIASDDFLRDVAKIAYGCTKEQAIKKGKIIKSIMLDEN